MKVIIFGGIGTLLRYLLNMYFPIIIINIIAVVIIGIYRGNKKEITTGFLGGFSSLSAIYVATLDNFMLLIFHFVVYYLIYAFIKKVLCKS